MNRLPKERTITAAPPSLLIVDDDEDTRLNLDDIFSDLGYRVETAPDGPTALEKARRGSFDVALLDLMLPGMDGLTLYRAFHQLCPETAALLITGEPHHPRAAECLQAGMKYVIPKPLDIPPLAKLLAEIAN
jgi:CheY-like chemotaxis protein